MQTIKTLAMPELSLLDNAISIKISFQLKYNVMEQ